MNYGESCIAYIAFGGNVGDVAETIGAARHALDDLFRVNLVAHSSLYISTPHGDIEQDNYINAVSSYQTSLSAEQLLKEMFTIELRLGRTRKQKWGPRTIDLDLLLYGQKVIESDELTVPHPRIQEREFVLYPLNEIAPELMIPEQGLVSALTACCPLNGLQKITDDEDENTESSDVW